MKIVFNTDERMVQIFNNDSTPMITGEDKLTEGLTIVKEMVDTWIITKENKTEIKQ